MSSCSEAFIDLRPCAILVVGVAGSMPIHGIGTALFLLTLGDREVLLRVHNCLLCHGEESFNLLSVSQMLRSGNISVLFNETRASIEIKQGGTSTTLPLTEVDGLYELKVRPISLNDRRRHHLKQYDLTCEDDPSAVDNDVPSPASLISQKSPSKLGNWKMKVFWVSTKKTQPNNTMKILMAGSNRTRSEAYDENLKEFCQSYFPPAMPREDRKTYQVSNISDMADLSIRFMGVGNDRLTHTLERSKGLTPCKRDEKTYRVPPHHFPLGKWASGKTPRVSKDKVKYLHKASIAEVCFTDTFETDDKKYRYGQAVVDYRSRYGDIIPIKSRKKVGWAFGEFCNRHFVPRILIRDNIPENVGGELAAECHRRGVKSAYICPYTSEQNYAEGYLGRITAMASFAMVYSGAPMHLWRFCIICAVFINNITATYFSKEKVWATPFELMHGEPYPDSGIVVPFGCGCLVLLREEEREKFRPRCALMVFIHYAINHPLYTYAVYSPKTKRVLYRQDVIFLTNVFPMREARVMGQLEPDGDKLVTYRSRQLKVAANVVNGDDEVSFAGWTEQDDLPLFEDHVSGFHLGRPQDDLPKETTARGKDWPRYSPDHASFGPPSCVHVPVTWELLKEPQKMSENKDLGIKSDSEKDDDDEPRRSLRKRDIKNQADAAEKPTSSRRPVHDRWFYEAVIPAQATNVVSIQDSTTNINQGNHELLSSAEHLEIVSEPNSSAIKTLTTEEFILGCAFEPMNVKIPPELSRLGPLMKIPEESVRALEDNEAGACYLHGTLFYDDELEWCKVTGWGVECGTTLVYYVPLITDATSLEEHHASVKDVLAWVKSSPPYPMNPGYRPSRTLKKSTRVGGKCLLTRIMACEPVVLEMGSVCLRPEPRIPVSPHLLMAKTIRKILKAQESLFKYGTFIPRNDTEADRSPESIRWKSGRQLEWLRLKKALTFETSWTWTKIQQQFPSYRKEDIGNMFYIYDYKFSGEHRVRLVFNGAKQSPATYTETFAPTVRAESVRLFHIYAVEYAFTISQYDVPQAFLRSDADCDIFVYPPRGNVEFPGQILKLSKMLYGSKQAAALWYNLINTFLKKMGFISSAFDPCFYRRPITTNAHNPELPQSDAIIILHVDDMRVAATPAVLQSIHAQLFAEFEITTSDTGRFLGMDTHYDLTTGILKMHMSTYIETSVQRFKHFDTTLGVPFREVVGCLMWIALCIMGPELLRVKDLARRSNDYSRQDYDDALKVLDRMFDRRNHGIVYRRGGADKIFVPASSRLGGDNGEPQDEEDDKIFRALMNAEDKYEAAVILQPPNEQIRTYAYSVGDEASINELAENDMYKLNPLIDDESLDIGKVLAPTNSRFRKVAYSDASFAVGTLKQSITGFVVMINGIPVTFGSLKQTVVVDSTCSAEYVAASVTCKQILEVENMVQFLGFTCPKPYTMYTDSQAVLAIATSNSTLGKVRHLQIRYHLIRCVILAGDVELYYCVTEDMLADLFTKIVSGAQDKRLAVRFYNDCVFERVS